MLTAGIRTAPISSSSDMPATIAAAPAAGSDGDTKYGEGSALPVAGFRPGGVAVTAGSDFGEEQAVSIAPAKNTAATPTPSMIRTVRWAACTGLAHHIPAWNASQAGQPTRVSHV